MLENIFTQLPGREQEGARLLNVMASLPSRSNADYLGTFNAC